MPAPVSMYVRLSDEVGTILGRLSRRERRDPRDQAALFIEDGLRRAGALPVEVTSYRDVTNEAAGSPATSKPA
jgi:hypothetical protein